LCDAAIIAVQHKKVKPVLIEITIIFSAGNQRSEADPVSVSKIYIQYGVDKYAEYFAIFINQLHPWLLN